MNRSVDRILTTHCGSLPRPKTLMGPLHAKDSGGSYDREKLAASVRNSVAEVVRRQIELGIDIIDDGEKQGPPFSERRTFRN